MAVQWELNSVSRATISFFFYISQSCDHQSPSYSRWFLALMKVDNIECVPKIHPVSEAKILSSEPVLYLCGVRAFTVMYCCESK